MPSRTNRDSQRQKLRIAFKTKAGSFYVGEAASVLARLRHLEGTVQLVVTSPPFPLNKKKSYGNYRGMEYLEWFSSLAPVFAKLLKPNGSIVIEIGNAWEPGRPIQSLLPLESLMKFLRNKDAGLRLCQQFICYNPSRLPSPAAWVTTQRIRTVDSYTHVWWMSKTDYPKADNRRVLRPYSKSMQELLARQTFNSGKRPSQHKLSETGFLKDCGGSIAHNFLELDALDPNREHRLPNAFSFSNTLSNDYFSRICQKRHIIPHPARMPVGLAAFFIQFLTRRGDLVLDPFAGSGTTGYAAERLGRRWLAIEVSSEYGRQAKIRFGDPQLSKNSKLKP
jgi:DNA modification methylase